MFFEYVRMYSLYMCVCVCVCVHARTRVCTRINRIFNLYTQWLILIPSRSEQWSIAEFLKIFIWRTTNKQIATTSNVTRVM